MASTTEMHRDSLLAWLRKPRAVWFVPVLALLALLAWVFASPVGASPDDDFHLTSVWCANPSNASCVAGPTATSRVVPKALVDAPCFAADQDKSAACQAKDFTFSPKPTVTTSRGNFDGEYPPVYYATMSIFAGSNIVISVLLMRVFTIVLFLGITVALYLLLPVFRRQTLIWSWAITTIPLGFFLLASNNPSSWAIIGLGSAWQALLGYFETTGRRRIALGAIFALSVVMAAGARGDAALYSIVAIGVVFWLTFVPRRAYLLQSILPVAMVAVAICFALTSSQSGVGLHGFGGGSTQAVTADGSVAATTGGALTGPKQGLSGFGLFAYNLLNVPSLWAGAFGNWALGWLDTPMPAVVTFGVTAVFVAVAFAGFARLTWRKVIAAAALVLLLVVIPVYVLQKSGSTIGANVQPRYILPLIVLLGGVLLLMRANEHLPLSRPQRVLLVTTLALANLVALHLNMQRYVLGNSHAALSLDSNIQWWWSMAISPNTVWAVGSVAYAAMLVIIVREISRPTASGLIAPAQLR
jgi:Predicted membrane protein (DUF2142)